MINPAMFCAYLVDGRPCDNTEPTHVRMNLGHPFTPPTETHPTNPRNHRPSHNASHAGSSGISGTRIADTGWEEPVPVDTRPLPPFPVANLGKLGEFVAAGAASLQVPPDLMAFSCLATIATGTGGRVRTRVKPDWYETTRSTWRPWPTRRRGRLRR